MATIWPKWLGEPQPRGPEIRIRHLIRLGHGKDFIVQLCRLTRLEWQYLRWFVTDERCGFSITGYVRRPLRGIQTRLPRNYPWFELVRQGPDPYVWLLCSTPVGDGNGVAVWFRVPLDRVPPEAWPTLPKGDAA